MTYQAQPSPGAPAASSGPLSSEHLQRLAQAQRDFKKLRRTAGVAKASAWTTGVFAGITLLGILFGDIPSLILGGALLAIAIREGKWGARLSLLDLRAPSMLAGNQIALGVVIILYALYQMQSIMHSTGLSGANQPIGDPRVDPLLGDIGGMVKRITTMFYITVALGGALGTGLMALYYYRRRDQLRVYVNSAEPWILDVMRTGG